MCFKLQRWRKYVNTYEHSIEKHTGSEVIFITYVTGHLYTRNTLNTRNQSQYLANVLQGCVHDECNVKASTSQCGSIPPCHQKHNCFLSCNNYYIYRIVSINNNAFEKKNTIYFNVFNLFQYRLNVLSRPILVFFQIRWVFTNLHSIQLKGSINSDQNIMIHMSTGYVTFSLNCSLKMKVVDLYRESRRQFTL